MELFWVANILALAATDAGIKGEVTTDSPRELTRDEAARIFEVYPDGAKMCLADMQGAGDQAEWHAK